MNGTLKSGLTAVGLTTLAVIVAITLRADKNGTVIRQPEAVTMLPTKEMTTKEVAFAAHVEASEKAEAEGDLARAESEIRKALEYSNIASDLRLRLARILDKTERRNAALLEYEAVLYPEGFSSTYEDDPNIILEYAEMKADLGEEADVLPLLETAVDAAPKTLGRHLPRLEGEPKSQAEIWSRASMASAFKHFSHGSYALAAKDARKAVRHDASDAAAHYYLGLSLDCAGQWQEAESALLKAKDLAPDDKVIAREADRILSTIKSRRHMRDRKSNDESS